MIGAKLSDQRNSSNAGRFKSTNQRLASHGFSVRKPKNHEKPSADCLFYFRSVKFHYVKETHMMLVAFWRTLVKIVVVFKYKRQRNKSFSRFVYRQSENTDSGLKVRALHYANELLVRVRLPLKKLLQSSQTSRHNKKLSKQVLVMINHILANSQINSIPE